MLCSFCETFTGIPPEGICPSCRTAGRIKAILTSGRLGPAFEDRVLLALRNCVGALSDLLEVAGGTTSFVAFATTRPVGGAAPLSGAGAPEAPPAEETKPRTSEQTTEKEDNENKRITLKSRSRSPKKEEDRPSEKGKVRKKKLAKKEKKEESTGAEGALKKKKKAEKDKKEAEEKGKEESTSSKKPAESEHRGVEEKKEEEEKQQEEVQEETHPGERGGEPRSGVFQVRGSVADSLERSGLLDPATTRPSEPSGPPPGYHGGYEEETRRRERSRSRTRRGTKGVGHRERGRTGLYNHNNTFGQQRWHPRQR